MIPIYGHTAGIEGLNQGNRLAGPLAGLNRSTTGRKIAYFHQHSKGHTMETTPRMKSTLNIVLWILQALFALAFLNAGYLKTFKPIQEIAPTIFWAPALPEAVVRFIGVAELLGGLGLILPALLKIRPQLTTLAAACLTVVMLLANIFHIARGEFFVLPMTGLFLLLLAFIAYGRWKLSPFSTAATN